MKMFKSKSGPALSLKRVSKLAQNIWTGHHQALQICKTMVKMVKDQLQSTILRLYPTLKCKEAQLMKVLIPNPSKNTLKTMLMELNLRDKVVMKHGKIKIKKTSTFKKEKVWHLTIKLKNRMKKEMILKGITSIYWIAIMRMIMGKSTDMTQFLKIINWARHMKIVRICTRNQKWVTSVTRKS